MLKLIFKGLIPNVRYICQGKIKYTLFYKETRRPFACYWQLYDSVTAITMCENELWGALCRQAFMDTTLRFGENLAPRAYTAWFTDKIVS